MILRTETAIRNNGKKETPHFNNPGGMDYASWIADTVGADNVTKEHFVDNGGESHYGAKFKTLEDGYKAQAGWYLRDNVHENYKKEIKFVEDDKVEDALKMHAFWYNAGGDQAKADANYKRLYGPVGKEEHQRGANLRTGDDKRKAGGGKGLKSKHKIFGGGGPDELNNLLYGANRIVSKKEYEEAANSGEGRMSEGPSLPIDKEYDVYKKAAEQDKQDAKRNEKEIKSIIDSSEYVEEPEQVDLNYLMSKQKQNEIKKLGGGAASTSAETDPHKKADDQKLDPNSFKGLPLYRQYDTRWGNHTYDTGSIAQRGCGPTGMAMIATWATGKDDITPDKAADWSASHGHSVSGQGTAHGFPDAYAKEFGFGMKAEKASKEAIDAGLAKGPLLNNQGPGYFTGGGHYIVIAGKRSDDTYVIHDPNSNKNNVTPTSKIDAKTLTAAADQIWVPEGAKGSLEKSGGTDVAVKSNTKSTPTTSSSSSGLGLIGTIASIGSSIGGIAQTLLAKALGIKLDAPDPNAVESTANTDTSTPTEEGKKDEGTSANTTPSGSIPHIDGPGHGISDMKKSDFKYNEELKKRANTDAISIHHPGSDSNKDFSAAEIHEMHRHRVENGKLWAGIGYNLVIRKNGDTEEGRPIDYQGAHTCGSKNNSHVFGVSLTGNHEAYDPSNEQMDSLAKTIAEVCIYYGIPCDRKHVTGHCEWNDNGYHGQGGDGSGCPGVKLYAKIPEAIEKAKKLIDDYNSKKKGGGKKKDLKAKLKEIKGSEFIMPQQEEKLGGGAAVQNQQRIKKVLTDTKQSRKEIEKLFDSKTLKTATKSKVFGGGDGQYTFDAPSLTSKYDISYKPSLLDKNKPFFDMPKPSEVEEKKTEEIKEDLFPNIKPSKPSDPEAPKTLPFFKMTDPRWADTIYEKGKSHNEPAGPIKASACGPSSYSMVESWVTGKNELSPEIVAKAAVPYHGDGGTDEGFFNAHSMNNYGVPWKTYEFNANGTSADQFFNKVDSGIPGMICVSKNQGSRLPSGSPTPNIFTSASHYMVVAGKRKDGSYILYDPNEKSDQSTEPDKGFTRDELKYAYTAGFMPEVQPKAGGGRSFGMDAIEENDRSIRDKSGNIIGMKIPDYNVINKNDDKLVIEAKKEAQRNQLKQKPKYDTLGNIIGLEIPDYNLITEEDDKLVIEAKKEAQREQRRKILGGGAGKDKTQNKIKPVKIDVKSLPKLPDTPVNLTKRYKLTYDELQNLQGIEIPDEIKITGRERNEIEKWAKQEKQISLWLLSRGKHLETIRNIKNSSYDFFDADYEEEQPEKILRNQTDDTMKLEQELNEKVQKHKITFNLSGNILMQDFRLPGTLYISEEDKKDRAKFIKKQLLQVEAYVKAKDGIEKKKRAFRQKKALANLNDTSVSAINDRWDVQYDGLQNIKMDDFKIPKELIITAKDDDKTRYTKQKQQLEIYDKQKKEELKAYNSIAPADIAKRWNVKFDEFKNIKMSDYKVPKDLEITSKDDPKWSEKQRKQLEAYDKQKKKEKEKNKPKFTGPIRNSVEDFFGRGAVGAQTVEKTKEEKELEAKIRKYGILFDTDGNIFMDGFKVPEKLKLTDEERKNKEKFIAKQTKQIETYLNTKGEIEEVEEEVAKGMWELDKNLRPSRNDAKLKAERERKKDEKIKKEAYSTQRNNKFGIEFDDVGNIMMDGFEVPEEMKITPEEKNDRDLFFNKQNQQIDLWIKYQNRKKKKKSDKEIKSSLDYIFGNLDKYKDKKKIDIEDMNSFDLADTYDVKFDEFGNVMMEGFKVPDELRISKEEIEKSEDDKEIKEDIQIKQHEQLVMYAKMKEKNLLDRAKGFGLDPKVMNSKKLKEMQLLGKASNALNDFFGIGQLVGKLEKSPEEKELENKIKKFKIQTDSLGNLMMDGFKVPAELRINEDEKNNSEIYNNKLQQQVELFTRKKSDEILEEMKKIQTKKSMWAEVQEERDKKKKEEEEKNKGEDKGKDRKTSAERYYATQRENKFGLSFDENGNVSIPSFEAPKEMIISKDEKKARDQYFTKRLMQIDAYVKFKEEEKRKEDEERRKKQEELRGKNVVAIPEEWKKRLEDDEYEQLTPAQIAEKYNVQFDDVGNVMMEGFEIPDGIKIDKDDDDETRFSKQRQQLELFYDQERNKKREKDYENIKNMKFKELDPTLANAQKYLYDSLKKFVATGKFEGFKVEKTKDEMLLDAKIKKYKISFDSLGNVMMDGFVVPDELRITATEKESSDLYDAKQEKQIGMYNEKAKKIMEDARKAHEIAEKKQKEEKEKQQLERKQANRIAEDKRLRDEIEKKTSSYKLKYDEFGNLNMPNFTVPDHLRITEAEKNNKVIVIKKKLEQIDKYLEFKIKHDEEKRKLEQEKREQERKQREEMKKRKLGIDLNDPNKKGKKDNNLNPIREFLGKIFGLNKDIPIYKIEKPKEELLLEAKASKYRIKFDKLGNVQMPGFVVPKELKITETEKKYSDEYNKKQEKQIELFNKKTIEELKRKQKEAQKAQEKAKQQKREEEQRQKLEKNKANRIAEDKRLEAEIDKKTKDYKLKYDAYGNLNMPDFVVPNELRITADEKNNKVTVVNKKLQQIDMYLKFKEKQEQDKLDETKKKREELEQIERLGTIKHPANNIEIQVQDKHKSVPVLTPTSEPVQQQTVPPKPPVPTSKIEVRSEGDKTITHVTGEHVKATDDTEAGRKVREVQEARQRMIYEQLDSNRRRIEPKPVIPTPPVTSKLIPVKSSPASTVLQTPSKEYGGGFSLNSIIKAGAVIHAAGQAGVFGQNSGNRKHRGIGGFFEGMIGGLFGRKKKDEPTSTNKTENNSQVVEKPKEKKHEGIRRLFDKWFGKKKKKDEETQEHVQTDANAIEVSQTTPALSNEDAINKLQTDEDFRSYYDNNIKGKMDEKEFNAPVFDGENRDSISTLKSKFLKTTELNAQQPAISVPGGSGIDPLSLARTTVNDSNLADSSTGTKGVTPNFFDQAASKYGKQVKSINVNDDNEIKSALNSGKELIAGGREHGGSNLFSATGHYVNMKGIGGGSVEVRDPSGISYVTDINNLLPGIRNPEGPNYLGQVGGGFSDFDIDEMQKKINDQEKKNKQNISKFGAGAIEGEVSLTNPNSSIGDNYVLSTMSTDTNELLDAVRALNIKPEMSELITYVKMLVEKQDDIVTTLSRYGGGYRYGGGSDSPTSSHDSQSSATNPVGFSSKPNNPNGNKPGSIKVDQKKSLEKAIKIARAAGFA